MTDIAPTLWQRVRHTRIRDALRGRFNASLHWRLVVANANLSRDLEVLIVQVVQRTRLWRQEKVDVATELVAHFHDGLEAGQSADDLLKAFGDPQQAAQLIRRAKKRGRPLMWHFGRYALFAFAFLVALYLLASLYMATGRPSIKVDYLAVINERAAAVSKQNRAWPLYREALLALGANQTLDDPAKALEAETAEIPDSAGEKVGDVPNADAVGFHAATTLKPGDEHWPIAEQYLNNHADSIAQLREAASRTNLGFVAKTSYAAFSPEDRAVIGASASTEYIDAHSVDKPLVISALLSDVQLLRSVAVLLASDARRAASQGDGDTAFANSIALFGVSSHCEEKPFLVSLLVANAIQRQAFDVIEEILSAESDIWTNIQLRNLAHCIAAADIDWRRGAEGERAAFYDVIQRLYTDDGHGDGRLVHLVADGRTLFEWLDEIQGLVATQSSASPLSNDGIALLLLPAANTIVASRREMTDMYDRLMDQAQQMIETPLWHENRQPSLHDGVRAVEKESFGLRYVLVNLLFPAYDALRDAIITLDGTRDGVLIGIALELYHREHGKWPKKLNELAPRWLPELPIDRMNGGPLGYRIIDDRPLIYSVGADFDDDNGQPPVDSEGKPVPHGSLPVFRKTSSPPNGDWVIWSTVRHEESTEGVDAQAL